MNESLIIFIIIIISQNTLIPIGEMHTLLMIDPDVDDNPTVGTKEKPIVHWLITNIPNGIVDQGDVTLSYRGSMLPADGTTNRYQFLLYQQDGAIDVIPEDYTPGCDRYIEDVTETYAIFTMIVIIIIFCLVAQNRYHRTSANHNSSIT